jgi:hypothetical protein
VSVHGRPGLKNTRRGWHSHWFIIRNESCDGPVQDRAPQTQHKR